MTKVEESARKLLQLVVEAASASAAAGQGKASSNARLPLMVEARTLASGLLRVEEELVGRDEVGVAYEEDVQLEIAALERECRDKDELLRDVESDLDRWASLLAPPARKRRRDGDDQDAEGL